ncbi:hypothetical protein IF1G_04551 [Cordyceps javanica]|uniref:Uncharacterized protein n=1 Tax=Cordyceps javanica TaxID=43265 RepID=A0A545V6H6_9HYPO|nr:hypothetical protein IF1G_04551 [Cordyceps javanica]
MILQPKAAQVQRPQIDVEKVPIQRSVWPNSVLSSWEFWWTVKAGYYLAPAYLAALTREAASNYILTEARNGAVGVLGRVSYLKGLGAFSLLASAV